MVQSEDQRSTEQLSSADVFPDIQLPLAWSIRWFPRCLVTGKILRKPKHNPGSRPMIRLV